MKTPIAVLTISIFLLAAPARAQLSWEQIQIELHPAAGDKEAVGHFKYKNVGEKPVRIKSARSSCGCTVAKSQRDLVAPGESGEITATFNIGDRTGTQIKGITVETDDPVHPTSSLVLKTVIAQPLEIQPPMVAWQNGEAPKPKTVTVKAGKDFPVKELKVTPSGQEFETKVSKSGEGEFKIEIQPKDTSHMAATTITIQPDNSSKKVYAVARVMPPSKPASVQQ
jgi:hypothetical protein